MNIYMAYFVIAPADVLMLGEKFSINSVKFNSHLSCQ